MTVPGDFLFWYKAKVVNVVDGDTLDLRTDLGFRITFLQRYRLYGVDTPELNDPDPAVRARAMQAKDFVEVLVKGKEVMVNTHMDRRDKYGRWLAVVYWRDPEGGWQNLNEDLVANGLAAPLRPDSPISTHQGQHSSTRDRGARPRGRGGRRLRREE